MSAFLHEIKKFFLITCTCNSVYSDSTFGLSVLFLVCHVFRVLEPLKNCASSSLIAFANSKDSDKPVLKRNQSLFCYNPQSMEVHVDQSSLLAQLGSYISTKRFEA